MPPSDSPETALTTALQGLDQREMEAYRYALKTRPVEIAEETAEKMYQAFLQGKTCEDIR